MKIKNEERLMKMAQTNHAWRKVVSVFLCLVMCFTSYVLCVPTANALVDNGNANVQKEDQYGTPVWDGTMDRWGVWGTEGSSQWLKLSYPSHIYLDVSETLESAGYRFDVSWGFGASDSPKFRIVLTGGVWGDNNSLSRNDYPSGYFTMEDYFSDYSADSSPWTNNDGGTSQIYAGGPGSEDGTTYDVGVYYDVFAPWSNETITYRSNGISTHYATIYLKGTPSKTGTATYTTTGENPILVAFQEWGKNWAWEDEWWKEYDYVSKPDSVSEQAPASDGNYYPEIFWDITIYDKSSLQDEIDRAEAFRDAFLKWNSPEYVTAGSWDAFLTALQEAKDAIVVRETTQETLDAAQSKLRQAAEALEFNVDETNLNNQLSNAASYYNDRDNLKDDYTAATWNAFITAYEAADAFTTPNRWKPYANSANVNAEDFQARSDELQTKQEEVNTLASNLTDAFNKLLKKASFAEFDTHYADNKVTGTCYTAASLKAYNDAVAAVEELRDTDPPITSQSTVDSTIDAYLEAFQNLTEEHTYNEDSKQVEQTPATCEQEGLAYQYCAVCNTAYQEIILPATGHVKGEPTGESFAGDCQNAPWVAYDCVNCDEDIIEYGEINPNAHVWEAEGEITTRPTCTTPGVRTFECTVDGCSATRTESVDPVADAHVKGEGTHVAADCLNPGKIEYYCTEEGCGALIEAVVLEDEPALGHEYNFEGDPVSSTDGDCVIKATETYKCIRCDHTTTIETAVNPSIHHSELILQNAKEGTCTEEGYSGDWYCESCKTIVTQGSNTGKNPDKHSSTDTYIDGQKDATCTENGYTGDVRYSCCHQIKEEGTVITAPGHNFEKTETVLANCQQGGYELWACANCEYTEKRNETGVNAENHANSTPVLVEGTIVDPKDCTKPYNTGDYKYTCCDTIVSGEHDAPYADHEWDNGAQEGTVYVYHCTHEGCEVTKKETCHHTGGTATCISKPVCDICHQEYGNLNPDNHGSIVEKDAVAATCTTDGREAGTYCNDCGKWVTGGATIEKTGHDYQVTGTEVITKATCKTPATIKYTYTCANGCGDTYDETKTDVTGALDSENHEDIVTDAAIAATCTTPGKTEGSHCEACGVVRAPQETVDALGHEWGAYTTTKEPTCTEAGEKTAHCTRTDCDETDVQPVEATGHDMGDWYVKVESTCKDYGYEQSDCSKCDYFETRPLTELAEHNYQWVTTGGSCTEGVTKQLKCTVCGDIRETSTEEPTGHTLGEWTVTVEPGCTTAGSRYALCSVCGETVTESIPATGHTYGEGVLILHPEDADDGIGLMRYTCINCGYWYDREITDTGHTHHGGTATCVDRAVCEECGREYGGYDSSNHVNVVPMPDAEATCETDGHTGGTYCTACGATVDEPVITTPATGHVDADGDGICDVDGKPVTPEDDDEEDDIWSGYRCKMCDEYEENKDKPFIGFFYMIIHFFVHLISYINHLT